MTAVLARGKNRILLLTVLVTVSACATLAGIGSMIRFNGTPGTSPSAPARWPENAGRHGGERQLLVFLHPMCSCSGATLEELKKVLDRREGAAPLQTRVLFFRPQGLPDAATWKPGDLWNQARRLPGAAVKWDEGGALARRFGARTSGSILLYSAAGELLFQGGVTESRGHVGDNFGEDRLAAALATGRSSGPRSPVFGCALGNPGAPVSPAADVEITEGGSL